MSMRIFEECALKRTRAPNQASRGGVLDGSLVDMRLKGQLLAMCPWLGTSWHVVVHGRVCSKGAQAIPKVLNMCPKGPKMPAQRWVFNKLQETPEALQTFSQRLPKCSEKLPEDSQGSQIPDEPSRKPQEGSPHETSKAPDPFKYTLSMPPSVMHLYTTVVCFPINSAIPTSKF